MKYKDQFYNEGFGTTFYLKPLKYIKKTIKNVKFRKFLMITLKVLYTIIFIVIGIIMFIINFPL